MPEFAPRILRPNDAAYYCGMGRTLFERIIRPVVPTIRLGDIGIGYDRIDLDAAIDDYKARNTGPCPPSPEQQHTWQKNEQSKDSHSTRKRAKAESSKQSRDSEKFADALRQVRGEKPNQSSTK